MNTSDVLIIGGGVIGLLSGYELAKRGASATLLERNAEVGREASWAAAGFLRQRITTDDPYGWIAKTSDAAFPELAQELLETTGIDSGYRRCGGLQTALTEDSRDSLLRFRDFHRSRGVSVEWVEPSGVVELEPNLTPETLGACHYPDDAQIRPPRFLKALAASFERHGGRIVTNAPAHKLLVENDRCVGARTETQDYGAQTTLLAAGCWSGPLADQAGLFLPVRPVRGQMMRLDAPRNVLSRVVSVEETYLVQRDDGTFIVGATVEEAGFDKSVTDEGIDELRRGANRAMPLLARREITMTWAGLRPAPAKRFPYIGEAIPGLWFATGHHRVGILLSPATARIVAEGVLTGETPVPLGDFSPERDRPRVDQS